jgi:hypothetical protein
MCTLLSSCAALGQSSDGVPHEDPLQVMSQRKVLAQLLKSTLIPVERNRPGAIGGTRRCQSAQESLFARRSLYTELYLWSSGSYWGSLPQSRLLVFTYGVEVWLGYMGLGLPEFGSKSLVYLFNCPPPANARSTNLDCDRTCRSSEYEAADSQLANGENARRPEYRLQQLHHCFGEFWNTNVQNSVSGRESELWSNQTPACGHAQHTGKAKTRIQDEAV